MPKRVIDIGGCGAPLLDMASYARPGPARRDHLSAAELEHISLTVSRTPEVMIKVLTKGGQSLRAMQRHIGYIGRYGDLEIETDEGQALQGRGVGKDLLEDWDLDLEEYRRHANLAAAYGRQSPRLVHKVIFSMPPGTPPEKVLAAVRNFAREEFALKHRYAMVLHTDEPQPHVHMVIKAVSEQSVRLNIRKATLRQWRAEFARQLRAQGVPANATERAVRGQSRAHKSDGVYRAFQRGASTHVHARIRAVANELSRGALDTESGKSKLVQTRREVVRGWLAMRETLNDEERSDLADQVSMFVKQMPPPWTEREWLARDVLDRVRQPRVVHGMPDR